MAFRRSYLHSISVICVLAFIAAGHIIPDFPASTTGLEPSLELQAPDSLTAAARSQVTEAPSIIAFQDQFEKRQLGATCIEWSIAGLDGKWYQFWDR